MALLVMLVIARGASGRLRHPLRRRLLLEMVTAHAQNHPATESRADDVSEDDPVKVRADVKPDFSNLVTHCVSGGDTGELSG